MKIHYLNRLTKQREIEKIYQGHLIKFLYSSFLGRLLLPFVAKWSLFSTLYGKLQKRGYSKKKIWPFIEKFNVNTTEFLEPVENFSSFNDFFIRKLKSEARPIYMDAKTAIIPADGRYYFYQNIKETKEFLVKGKKFLLKDLLQDEKLAEKYEDGSLVLARLCPSDYHRFHFPCDCTPTVSRLINGPLYSVNPIALVKNIGILSENKRMVCEIKTEGFGTILFIEIGATCVGTIAQTYTPETKYKKGEEKGYFEFGGSSLILLFEKDRIIFDQDLIEATQNGIEILCLLGQSLGKCSC